MSDMVDVWRLKLVRGSANASGGEWYPSHLEPLTRAEHQRIHAAERETCRYGHPLDGQRATGFRFCRTCKRQSDRDYHARQMEAR